MQISLSFSVLSGLPVIADFSYIFRWSRSIIFPLSWIFFTLNYQYPSSFSFSINPLPFKSFVIPCYKFTMTMLFIMRVPAFISRAIFPCVNAKTMFFAIKKSSLVVFSIFVSHFASCCCQFIVWKLSLICPLISVFVYPLTMFFSWDILSFVSC